MVKIESELTRAIKKALIKNTPHTGVFGCPEVTIGWRGQERVDYITYDTKEIFRCYEIKISKNDFFSKNHNTFVGHYNYYVLPQALVEKVEGEIPKHIGIYVYLGDKESGVLNLHRRPKKQLVNNPDELKDSLLRCLYRDARLLHNSQDDNIIRKYKRELAQKDKRIHELNRTNIEYMREINALRRRLNKPQLLF